MLILTRRRREAVFIGHDVVVTVLRIRGDRVRIGIEAPRDIEVQREERLTQRQDSPTDSPSPSPSTTPPPPPR
jgi:carbon storage regulator